MDARPPCFSADHAPISACRMPGGLCHIAGLTACWRLAHRLTGFERIMPEGVARGTLTSTPAGCRKIDSLHPRDHVSTAGAAAVDRGDASPPPARGAGPCGIAAAPPAHRARAPLRH